MIGTYLGLGGRIRRLRYFLLSLGLGLAVSVVTFLFAFNLVADSNGEPDFSIASLWPILLVILPIYGWGTLMLMTKRFRDIGWEPLYVIPIWIGLVIIDMMLAGLFPEMVVGDGNETPLGMLVNAGMILALLFWPGADPELREFEPTAPVRRSEPAPVFKTIPRHNAVLGTRAGSFGRKPF